MGKLRPNEEPRNPLCADLTEEERAVIDGASSFLRGILAYASKLALARTLPATVECAPEGLLSKTQLAKALNVSASTVDRLVCDGMPCERVAARRRFHLDVCRTWLTSRGKRATKAKPSDRVDVNSVLARSGLRVAEGQP
jgi:hypothetical protein